MIIQVPACDICEKPRNNLIPMTLEVGGKSHRAVLCEECAEPFTALAAKLILRRRKRPARPKMVVLMD
jgi:hypothetical protein